MSDKIKEFPNKQSTEKEIEVLKVSLDAITEAMPELEGMEGMAALLSMPDEEFAIIAPPILMEMEKSLNNINDKLILTQALNAGGMKAEDLIAAFNDVAYQIDEKMTMISRPKKEFVKRVLGTLCNAIADTEGIAKKIIQIPIELCHEDAKIPAYAHQSDSGLDIFALEDITIHPGETKLIPTGLKVAIPLGYELQVRPKSGRALKTKFRVANTPGTIDAGYRDEIGVIIDNIEPPIKDITYESELVDGKPKLTITSILHGSDFHIGKGEKFAQLVLCEVPKASFYEVSDIEKIEGNRGGGFGSTGLE